MLEALQGGFQNFSLIGRMNSPLFVFTDCLYVLKWTWSRVPMIDASAAFDLHRKWCRGLAKRHAGSSGTELKLNNVLHDFFECS